MDIEHLIAEFAVRPLGELRLGPLALPITNTAAAEAAAALAMFLLLRWLARGAAVVPDRRGVVIEALVAFVRWIVESNARPEAMRGFAWFFALFCFVLAGNLAGLVPAAFAPHAQIVTTGALAVGVFATVLAILLVRHRWRFVRLFAPRGVPLWMLPLVVPIEAISFLARPVTLALRLFANMTAGHMVLGVIAALALAAPWWLAWLPSGFGVIQIGLEALVCLLQAYIFTVLACVYVDDALAGGH